MTTCRQVQQNQSSGKSRGANELPSHAALTTTKTNKVMRKLKAVVEFTDNNCSVYIPDVDGVVGIGETLEDTKESLKKSIEYCIEGCLEDGIQVPEPLCGEYEIEYMFDMKKFL